MTFLIQSQLALGWWLTQTGALLLAIAEGNRRWLEESRPRGAEIVILAEERNKRVR